MTSNATPIAAFSIFVGVVLILLCLSLVQRDWSSFGPPTLDQFFVAQTAACGLVAVAFGLWTTWSQSARSAWWTLLFLSGYFLGMGVKLRSWYLVALGVLVAVPLWRARTDAVQEISHGDGRVHPIPREPTPFD